MESISKNSFLARWEGRSGLLEVGEKHLTRAGKQGDKGARGGPAVEKQQALKAKGGLSGQDEGHQGLLRGAQLRVSAAAVPDGRREVLSGGASGGRRDGRAAPGRLGQG